MHAQAVTNTQQKHSRSDQQVQAADVLLRAGSHTQPHPSTHIHSFIHALPKSLSHFSYVRACSAACLLIDVKM